MSFDNVIFNVNGLGTTDLIATIKLALKQGGRSKVVGYSFYPEYGLVFYWSETANMIKLGSNGHNAEQLAKLFEYWVTTEEAATVEYTEQFEKDYPDCDVDTELGWRVYTGDWGQVNSSYAFFAIKPCYLWYGK